MEETIRRLKNELAEKDEQLCLAGKLGAEVLERYEDGCEAAEKRAKEHAHEIEQLEQQKYALQLKVEQKTFSESTYSEEVDMLKETLHRERQDFKLRLDTVNQSELTTLKIQLSSVRADLEKSQLSERQLRDRNAELDNLLEDVQERLKQKMNILNETTSEEIASLHSEISTLHGDKMALLKELGDVKDECEHTRLGLQTVTQRLHASTNDLEQQQCQMTSYFNALEKAREESKDLKAEMDVLRMENQKQNKKGNSLFSEVEDRRIEVEKQLISLKVKYEAEKKHNEANRQQRQRLTMQIVGLLQTSGRKADSEHIERLERQLMQARGEVDTLNLKMYKMDEERKSGIGHYNVDVKKHFPHSDGKNYMEFLKALLEKKEKELTEQEKELNTKGMILVAESDKLMQCERKLYASESQLQKVQAHSMQLHIRVEELTAKYEPDKLRAGRKVRKTITEKIPLTTTEHQQNNEETTRKQEEEEKQQQIIHNLQSGSNTKRDSALNVSTKTTDKTTLNLKLSADVEMTKTDSKRVLKTVPDNSKNVVSQNVELKSVQVRKVTMAEKDEVICESVSCEQASDRHPTDKKEESTQSKTKKSQHKKVKLSEQTSNECQTQ